MVRGIALKIFLSFWLIFAVLIAAFAVLPGPADVRFADHLTQHGVVAAAVLSRQGVAACNDYAQTVADEAGVAIELVDADGRRACGATATPGSPVVRSIATEGPKLSVRGVALPRFVELRIRPPFPFAAVLLAIVVSGVVCFWMARSLARPLQDVRATSLRVAAGDLHARAGEATTTRRDEIGDLGRAFNTMAERVEALVDAQGRLLSDISHELRSPLARLNVALELARRKAGPAAEADLRRIETEADRMNDLIGRVLSLARAEHDDGTEPAEDFELVDVVRDVVENAQFEATQQGKTVSLQTTASPTINGRAALVMSAVDNIVRNAVRYTPAGTSVDVAVDLEGADALVQVRDHGRGVPTAELERIFAPFHRVEPGRSPQSGGVGLGLAIAKRAAAVHGGSIVAENLDGGGLRVAIRLPGRRASRG